jgi:hypothetical protein
MCVTGVTKPSRNWQFAGNITIALFGPPWTLAVQSGSGQPNIRLIIAVLYCPLIQQEWDLPDQVRIIRPGSGVGPKPACTGPNKRGRTVTHEIQRHPLGVDLIIQKIGRVEAGHAKVAS